MLVILCLVIRFLSMNEGNKYDIFNLKLLENEF